MKFGIVVALVTLAPTVVHADAKHGEKKAQLCLICHKPNYSVAHIPTLEGQTREYLYNQIKAYKEKRRPDPTMQTNVAALSDKDMRDIAEYFAGRKSLRGSFQLDAERVAKGKSKANELKCAVCHMADFSGNKETPRLAGMVPQYVAAQIVDIAKGKRLHPPVDGLGLVSDDIAEELAQYFAQLH